MSKEYTVNMTAKNKSHVVGELHVRVCGDIIQYTLLSIGDSREISCNFRLDPNQQSYIIMNNLVIVVDNVGIAMPLAPTPIKITIFMGGIPTING